MSALGPGAVCCGEREDCEVIDCELAVEAPVIDTPRPLPEIVPDPQVDDDEDDELEEDDE